MEKLNVAIADDNEKMVEVLSRIIDQDEDLKLVGKAHNGEEICNTIKEKHRTFFRGVANNTPYYGCCTLSGLSSESKARSFSQKQNVVHASLRERGLLSASATWSIRPLGKSTASYIFVYIYIAVLAYYGIVVYQYCHITLYIYCLQ